MSASGGTMAEYAEVLLGVRRSWELAAAAGAVPGLAGYRAGERDKRQQVEQQVERTLGAEALAYARSPAAGVDQADVRLWLGSPGRLVWMHGQAQRSGLLAWAAHEIAPRCSGVLVTTARGLQGAKAQREWWEADVLVIDRIGFEERDRSGEWGAFFSSLLAYRAEWRRWTLLGGGLSLDEWLRTLAEYVDGGWINRWGPVIAGTIRAEGCVLEPATKAGSVAAWGGVRAAGDGRKRLGI